MSLVSSRRTYDTDSITLRRIFAYDLSNSPFSTGYILTSLTKGVATFLSPSFALSTIGVPNLPAQLSTLEGELVSTLASFNSNLPSSPTFFLPSTVTGLGTSGYVSTSYLTSTIDGLGSLGYLSSFTLGSIVQSSLVGLGSLGYISSPQLLSTVEGLGSAGYVSISQLYFEINATVDSLGSFGYLSTVSLISTVEGLGTTGYISSATLYSTIDGLANLGFISSLTPSIRSTFSNFRTGNWSNSGFLYSNLGPLSTVQTFQFDIGDAMRNQINPSTTNLDIEVKANLQFGYYDAVSRDYDFSTCLVKGVSLNTTSILAQENLGYYILNANPVNLPFFFNEKYRFVLNDYTTISTLKNDTSFSTMSVFHILGSNVPTTNQLFAYPAKPNSVTVVLDNTTLTNP